MNTGHLQTFVTLAEVGSFNGAARRLFLTPPAVKYALDALETETGLTLFVRTHAGLELTDSGRVFSEYAARIIALINEGISRATEAIADSRQRIDAPWMGMPMQDARFHRAFAAFKKAYPAIDVQLRRVDSFVGEHYDVINGFADVTHTHAIGHALCRMPLCCVVVDDHPLADRESVAVEDLAPYELLVPMGELVDRMDERTRAFLASKKDSLVPMEPGCIESDFYSWCLERGRAVLAIGEPLSSGGHMGLRRIPVDGASFEYCIFTQECPTAAVTTYVEFMQAFYAAEGAGLGGDRA